MAFFRVAPKAYCANTNGAGSTGGTGASWTPGATGPMTCLGLANAITAGTVKAGDRVLFAGSHGTYNLTDAADFPSSLALNSGFGSGTFGSGGIAFGDSVYSTSKASGIIFDGFGDGSQATFDMDQTAAGVTTTNRQTAALSIRGESIRVIGFKVLPATYNYIQAGIAGSYTSSSQAEVMSYENLGMNLQGAGFLVEYVDIDGHSSLSRNAMSRYGLQLMHPGNFITNASLVSKHLKTIIRYSKFKGCFHSFRIDPGGPGNPSATAGDGQAYTWREGSEFLAYGNSFLSPCFGFRVGDSDQPYNASSHGGHVSISGIKMQKSMFTDNYLSGSCQDGIDLITQGFDCSWNTVEDIISINPTIWQWNGSAWVQTATTRRDGNAIKVGLGTLEHSTSAPNNTGTYPTVWLGTDGDPGGAMNIKELANRLVGNKIRRCSANGFTANSSSGHYFGHNEVIDHQLTAFNLQADGSAGGANYVLQNNYAKMDASNVAFVACLDVASLGVKVLEYNNIWNSGVNAVARSAFDATYRQGTTGSRTGIKNIFVNGRRQLFNSSVYSGTNDVNGGSAQAINYVEGSGFPSGDTVGEGTADLSILTTVRTSGMTRDINKRRIWVPHNIGPYTRQGV